MEKLKKSDDQNNREDYLMAKAIETQVTELKKDVSYLTGIVKDGFAQIHLRQDVANGKIQKHEIQFAKIENKYMDKGDVKFLVSNNQKESIRRSGMVKDKVIWYLVGLAGTVVVFFIIKSLGG